MHGSGAIGLTQPAISGDDTISTRARRKTYVAPGLDVVPNAGEGAPGIIEAIEEARDDVDGNVTENVDEIERRLDDAHHLLVAWIERRLTGIEVGTDRAPIDVGDRRSLSESVTTTHHHPCRLEPVGACTARRRHSRMASGSTGRVRSSRFRTVRVVVRRWTTVVRSRVAVVMGTPFAEIDGEQDSRQQLRDRGSSRVRISVGREMIEVR